MKIPMKVTYASGEVHETAAVYPDFIKFENEFNRPATKLGADIYLRDIAWLAWSSLIRRQIIASGFDAWTETVEAIEMTGDGSYVPLESDQPIG
jgi:hypothetical protein